MIRGIFNKLCTLHISLSLLLICQSGCKPHGSQGSLEDANNGSFAEDNPAIMESGNVTGQVTMSDGEHEAVVGSRLFTISTPMSDGERTISDVFIELDNNAGDLE